MLYNIKIYFLLYIIYSFVGYIAEVIYVSIQNEKLTLSRGFFIGPILPIYGAGALIITLFLSSYNDQILVLLIFT